MTVTKRSVLITGCSDGGMGAALALEFHKAGFHVYATARNPDKMKSLEAAGIDTLKLDILSADSIASCVKLVPALDILINNAGAQMPMPLVDLSIEEGKKLFDLNVWSNIAVIQAFMPLLLHSKDAMIVNHTSSAAVTTVPLTGTYNASKAAMSMLSDTLRLELQPFNIQVVDLRTALVRTNIFANSQGEAKLPEGSIFSPAREAVEKVLRQEGFEGRGIAPEDWAKAIVRDLSKKNPPAQLWRGETAWLARLATILPHGLFDGLVKRMTGFDKAEQIIKAQR